MLQQIFLLRCRLYRRYHCGDMSSSVWTRDINTFLRFYYERGDHLVLNLILPLQTHTPKAKYYMDVGFHLTSTCVCVCIWVFVCVCGLVGRLFAYGYIMSEDSNICSELILLCFCIQLHSVCLSLQYFVTSNALLRLSIKKFF